MRAAIRLAAGAIVATLALSASPVRAGDPCPEGQPVVGDIGVRELTGLARFSMNGDIDTGLQRLAQFRTEPVITRLGDVAGSPLREGDVIVAIDGTLITTRDGGRRFANLEPGRPIRLTIRREGRRSDVRLVPATRCGPVPSWVDATPLPPEPPQAPSAPEAPSPPGPPVAPVAPVTPAPGMFRTPRIFTWSRENTPAVPEVAPTPEVTREAMRAAQRAFSMSMLATRGWFGLAIDCEDCHWTSLPADSGLMWVSHEYPTIYRVDSGSPAERAGLQRGDVLTQIDGISVLSPEGGRRFGAVKPGDRVRWTYRRDGRLANTIAVAVARPGAVGFDPNAMSQMRQELKRMSENDANDQAMRRKLADMETQMRDRERLMLRQRQQLAGGLQRLRWSGSVGDADVEVKGLGNVTVTTDDATGEIVVITTDATIHIRPSDTAKDRRAAAPRRR